MGLLAPAVLLGAWQMWERSPLPAPFDSPGAYYASVTAHGTTMAYVITTFFAMGMGYTIADTTLGRPMRGAAVAWVGFTICTIGSVLAIGTALSGTASVLYTFYPPLTGNPLYYLGALLVVGGSWLWCGVMVANMAHYKRGHPGRPVPLAMFAIVATALLWFWTSLGVAAELVATVLPTAFGVKPLIDPGLSRTLFSITLHGIVYFWLMPAYIAFYTMVPQAAGGRLYSDTLGRLTFILFLVASLPVGLHHLFADPEHGTSWKFMQSIFTAMVVLPTLLTIYTIPASLEIAGRLRGGKGVIGWVTRLPWDQPMIVAVALSLVMLGFGGFGGVVNMCYAMDSMVHNTQWVTAHFHLIFGGAVVIMYMAICYEFIPRLLGRPLPSLRVARIQLVLWAVGMIVLTFPWHVTGLMGMPRRYASFDYANPFYAPMGPLVICSVIGGLILLVSVIMLVVTLLATHREPRAETGLIRWALTVNPPQHVPVALNGFALWNGIVFVMMAVGYAYPIYQAIGPGALPVSVVVGGH